MQAVLNRTVSSTVIPLLLSNQTVAGTATSGQVFLNQIAINSDTLNTTGTGGPDGADYFYAGGSFGGSAMTGNRTAIVGVLNQSAKTGNQVAGFGGFFTGGSFNAQSSVNEGGTSGSGNAFGNLFAANHIVQLLNGATYWNSIVGEEIDVAIASGASAYYKEGFKVVQLSNDSVAGSAAGADYAIAMTDQTSGSPGWSIGIAFGSPDGWWPIQHTLGTLIGTYPGLGGSLSMQAANGINFSAVIFSNYAFQSPGFSVDGSGNVVANGLTANGSAKVDGLTSTGAYADQSADVFAATNAGSRIIPGNCSWEALTPSGTIAGFTSTMPASPADKQDLWISSTQTIMAFTLSPNAGQTVNGAPSNLAANTAVHYRYNSATATWFRLN